jgi:hypothetical protein
MKKLRITKAITEAQKVAVETAIRAYHADLRANGHTKALVAAIDAKHRALIQAAEENKP